MSINRFAARRDQNELGIVAALREVGAKVRVQDFPDLLVLFRNRHYVIEVSNPQNRYRQRSDKQREFLREFEVPIVTTAEEALVAIGAVRRMT